MKALKRFLARKSLEVEGTVYIDEYGEYWFYYGKGALYGDGGTYYNMTRNRWGWWKIDTHYWIKKPLGNPLRGSILTRVDKRSLYNL